MKLDTKDNNVSFKEDSKSTTMIMLTSHFCQVLLLFVSLY